MDGTGFNRRQLLGAGAALASASVAPAQVTEPKPDVAGRSALITGCSSGFGRLTALHMARGGATVIASMRNLAGGKRKEAQELADIAAGEKLKLAIVEIDVLSDAQVASGVRQAERIAGGPLDALVNNAGIGIGGPVEIADMAATQLIFDTNLFGYLRMARAVLPAMRARKQGVIVNVSSQLGRIVVPTFGLYSATKFGVEAMFETMAYELVPYGVEVAIIEPGGYPTKVWENGRRYSRDLTARLDAERKAAYAINIAAAEAMFSTGGSTDPNDVARAIAEVIAAKPGNRPLRRAVHPNSQAMEAANAALAKVQAAVLGSGRFADAHRAVTS